MSGRRTVMVAASAASLLLIVVMSGCGTGGTTGGGGYYGAPSGGAPSTAATGGAATGAVINEKGFAFDPATLTVKVGDTVTFTNQDSAAHAVEIDGKNLGNQSQGQSVTWKAEKAGTFPYKCTIHPQMVGTITVQ